MTSRLVDLQCCIGRQLFYNFVVLSKFVYSFCLLLCHQVPMILGTGRIHRVHYDRSWVPWCQRLLTEINTSEVVCIIVLTAFSFWFL